METKQHYVDHYLIKNKSIDEQIADVVKHWHSRYELGTAVVLCEEPALALKSAVRQWQKLTRQAQKARELNATAEDILNTTRIISRMQRVRFTSRKFPANPDKTFYVSSSLQASEVPINCFTFYCLGETPDESVIQSLAPDALVVMYTGSHPPKQLMKKSILEARVNQEESELIHWLDQKYISLDSLSEMAHTNEALDTLLSSNQLQTEFLAKTKNLIHTLRLAQPIHCKDKQLIRLNNLQRLERHVQVLSPIYISDHALDSRHESSFLLRDITAKEEPTGSDLEEFVASQRAAGNNHLAAAVEAKARVTIVD